ncbi:thiomuracin/GE37468 family thiazolyl RiPP peptide [Microbispora sp. NPDC046933]|uniref:thiomuracin/GE37468 family thiazolyl RiPP peptide n=1 Tax=Microbispora sp. NPDC046933 TaxID=3155618 RepID=UPI0033CBE32E
MSNLRFELESLEVESLKFGGEGGAGLPSLGMGHGMTEVGASEGCCCCLCSCCCCPCG